LACALYIFGKEGGMGNPGDGGAFDAFLCLNVNGNKASE
jgi:hypothetical protein